MLFMKTFLVDDSLTVDPISTELDLTFLPLEEVGTIDFADAALDIGNPPAVTEPAPIFVAPSTGFSSVSVSATAGVGVDGTTFSSVESSVIGNASLTLDVTVIGTDFGSLDLF